MFAFARPLARECGKSNFRIIQFFQESLRRSQQTILVKMAISKMKVNLTKTDYNFLNRLSLVRWVTMMRSKKVALFLCSDPAGYIQEVMLPVDGGFLSS